MKRSIPTVRPILAGLALLSAAAQSQSVDMLAITDDSSPTNGSTLISVSVLDGTQTLVGTPGVAIGGRNVDIDRVTGALLGTDIFGSQGTVYGFNRATGTSNPVALIQDGGNAVPIGAVAFAPNGTLYGIAGFNTLVEHELGVIDLAAETFSPILTFPAGRFYSGMDFTRDGVLFAVYSIFPNQFLETIDVGAPSVVNEIATGNFAVGDIDAAADGYLYHSNSSFALFRMDPVTGAQSNVGNGILAALDGVASAGAEPDAARAGFVGKIVLVDVDTGTGQFAGRGIGSTFSGIFNYGTSAAFASEVFTEPNERNFTFLADPYRSTLYDGATRSDSLEVSVNLQDDVALDADEAGLLSLLLGQTIDEGTVIDTLALAALSVGAFEQDPDPNDGDDEELLYNGVLFDMVFIDLDADLHSGLDYPTTLPVIDDVDLVAFTVTEGDANGQVLYTVVGVVSALVGDGDDDGIGDLSDNCQVAFNPDQRDSNDDGYGNLCDADLDNDCVVNFSDLGLLKSAFFGNEDDADFDGDGAVNFTDLGIMKAGFFAPPGPTALPNSCF